MKNYLTALVLLASCLACAPEATGVRYTSENLEIHPLTDKVYQHISYLQTESFGKVACNGMVVADQGEAVIFDTPADSIASVELIRWVETELQAKVKAVIPTHFHADCLGGLDIFHQRDIPSYAHQPTIALAGDNGSVVPQNGFDSDLELTAGAEQVMVTFAGEGHTRDNIIAYLPGQQVLFGGCLIKSLGAGKGYLGDANVEAWPTTVAGIKARFPRLTTVIPGHGAPGGPDLLDFTIELFSKE